MSATRRVAALAAVLAAFAASGIRAARLPDWAREIVETAPELGEEIEPHPSRVLLSETRLVVSEDGSFAIRRRFAAQALRDGAEVSTGWYHTDRTAKLETAAGWHVPVDGGRPRSETWRSALTLERGFAIDQRSHLVHIEGVRRGSLVFFEFEEEKVPTTLSYSLLFDEKTPTGTMALEVEAPRGWTIRHEWLRRSRPGPSIDGAVRRFEIRDLPGEADEPLGEPVSHLAPLLWVGFVPPAGSRTVAPAVPDLDSFGAWHEELFRGRDEVTPEIREAALLACSGAAENPAARVRAAVAFVRDRVRYVAREIGIGRYQPRPASQVLAELMGDCKDKATLLRAMLASLGIVSYPVLARIGAPSTFAMSVPSPEAFNHLIVGVSCPSGCGTDPSLRRATFDAGDLGPLVAVDATSEHASIGEIPEDLAGSMAIVLAGGRALPVTLPGTDPGDHHTGSRLHLEILPGGALRAGRIVRLRGQPAIDARKSLRASERDYRLRLERRLEADWGVVSFERFEAEDETPDGFFEERAEWLVPPPSAPETSAIALFRGATDLIDRVPLTRRTVPVVYTRPHSIRFETTLAGIGADVAIPAERVFSGDGWSASSRVRIEGVEVRAELEITLSRLHFPPEDFDDLRAFWAAIDRAASPAISYPP